MLFSFFILLALILTALTINRASETSSARLRKAFQGYFKIAAGSTDTEETVSLDDAFITSVMATGGLKSYNALDSCYLTVPDLILKPGRFTAEGSSKAQMTTFISNTDSSLNQYFTTDMLTLIEGTHIPPDSKGAALISRTLADLNGLNPGDTISAVVTEDISEDPDIQGEVFSFRISGIFDENRILESSDNAAECTIAANYIFIDQDSGRKIKQLLKGAQAGAYDGGVTFFVDDPEEMNQIINRILETVDTASLEITQNNAAYEQAMVPLKKLSSMTRIMTLVIAAIGCAILSLLLLLWERDRIHETGLLLSVGIKKADIFLQQWLECVFLFVLAFLLAALLCAPVSDRLGTLLYDNAVTEAAGEFSSPSVSYPNQYNETAVLEEPASFELQLSGQVLAGAGGIGLALTIVSTGISFLAAARKKPKELLTIME